MEWLIDPFEVSFVQRALWGGILVAGVCALAGTWVVLRGMAFLGDAMSHGMLPGVALASLLGGSPVLGAALAAGTMAAGVSAFGRSGRLSQDTGIGLLFVGMLSLGVIIVSRSQSFAVDLTGFLFGDVLAVRERDLVFLAVALVVAVVVSVLGHRSFVALTFDERTAHTLGLRPRRARIVLMGLVTLAIVASFHVVGTLLVFGLLIAPPAAALFWARRVPVVMLGAAALGAFATVTGLLISWHWGTAAGATIAAVAVALFGISALAARVRKSRLLAALVVLPLAACGTEAPAPPAAPPHGYVEGAEETAEPQPRLVFADADGEVRVLDLITEETTSAGRVPGIDHVTTDGRFAYLSSGGTVHVVDSGAWTVDHGDHVHYYRTGPKAVGELPGGPALGADSDSAVTAVVSQGHTALADRPALEKGTLTAGEPVTGVAVPLGERLVVADGKMEVRTREGATESVLPAECADPRGTASTRRGIVFGCADGAVVVSEKDGTFTAEKVPYPEAVSAEERADEFHHRPGSTTLAARAGDRGVWTFDVTAKTWQLFETGPVEAVNAVGSGGSVLTLTADGVLHALDPATGAETANRALITGPVDPGAEIQVDTSRAYVNDAAARIVHEVDYADSLRVARTLAVEVAPVHVVETGR
ncbi:hypothetical protein GCM10027445_43530 [Amycolatopsis endophytica]|uniref:ABC-type Mn2+/Zn2+ transport system permease subunit n=1 Tax=Amycolatopsis endophytica TaxID=860233 RepID=A0A853BEV3_9PSEU|nr:ABC-type Mn2+/Zn2+ transport system permease subunit [Amycolatopsis endophytica]